MTTDLMEVYSLEEGDVISHHGELFRFIETTSAPDGTVRVMCVDEEGYRRCISVPDDFAKLRIVCDTDHLADA